MKVGILVFSNFKVTPYLKEYTDILKAIDVYYDVIYWDRRNIDESVEFPTIKFTQKLDDGKSILIKLPYMIRYSSFVKKSIKRNKYDYVIVLTSLQGVLINRFLEKFYKNKYIFDIRDYSYEHIEWYRNRMLSLMNNSKLNVISSPGFVNFLPSADAYLCHNISFDMNIKTNIMCEPKVNKKVRVGFVGVIRFYSECVKFIDLIKNDMRIEFCFYGEGEDEIKLRNYCSRNEVINVKFFGAYKQYEKEEIIQNIDIIYNAYGNESPRVKYALSNKCYDAAWYKKPLIVNENTAMAYYTEGYSYAIKNNETNLVDNLLSWYNNIDCEYFNEKTEEVINKSISDNKRFKEKVISILK